MGGSVSAVGTSGQHHGRDERVPEDAVPQPARHDQYSHEQLIRSRPGTCAVPSADRALPMTPGEG